MILDFKKTLILPSLSFFFIFILFLLPVSGENISAESVEIEKLIIQYQEHISHKHWFEANKILEKIRGQASVRNFLLRIDQGYEQSATLWATQEVIKIILHKDNKGLKDIYHATFSRILSELREYNLWRESPTSAWDVAKKRVWKNIQDENKKATHRNSWNWKMENFKENIVYYIQDQAIYEATATSEEKVSYFNGLADVMFQVSHGDCRLSIPYFEKAWENIKLLSQPQLNNLSDFGWGKTETALKLFYCYKRLDENKKSKVFYEIVKDENREALYFPREYENILEASNNGHTKANQMKQGTLESSDNLRIQKVKVFIKSTCYELPYGYVVASMPQTVLSNIFLLGMDMKTTGILALFVFDKKTGVLIKKIAPTLLKRLLGVKNPPIFLSFVAGKLIVHNQDDAIIFNPYHFQKEAILNWKFLIQVYPQIASQLENTYNAKKTQMHISILVNQMLYIYLEHNAAGILEICKTNRAMIVSELKALLTDTSDTHSRISVTARVLRVMGEDAKEAIPGLIVLLKDVDYEVRNKAVLVLIEMGEDAKEATPELKVLLKSSDPVVQIQIIRVLHSMGVMEGAPELKELLKNNNFVIVSRALNILSKSPMMAKKAIPELISLLKNPDSMIYLYAFIALKQTGNDWKKDAISELISLLRKDVEPSVCIDAAETLLSTGVAGRQAIPELKKLLKDQQTHPSVRIIAGRVLLGMRVDEKEIIPELKVMLTHSQPDICDSAFLVLRIWRSSVIWTKKDIPRLLSFIRNSNNLSVRVGAANVIGTMEADAKEAIQALREALNNRKADAVYWEIQRALDKLMKLPK